MFTFRGGSVCGTEHDRNQDAYGWLDEGSIAFGVISDGCGEKAGSHVGSKLAVELLAQTFKEHFPKAKNHKSFIEKLNAHFLTRLSDLTEVLSSGLRSWESVIEEYLLFTVVGFVVDQNRATVFAAGDGVYSVNGEPPKDLGPFPDNAPPYIGYQLLKKPVGETLHVVASLPVRKLHSLLIGSDGVLHIPDKGAALAREQRFRKSPSAVIHELSKLSRTHTSLRVHEEGNQVRILPVSDEGVLEDDTTVILLENNSYLERSIPKKTSILSRITSPQKMSSSETIKPSPTKVSSNADFID